MKKHFLYILLAGCFVVKAQDKIYFTDGTTKLAKVLEIAPDNITIAPISESGATFVDANETISKNDILLIEYKNGLVEIYTRPEKSVVYNANGSMRKDIKKDGQEFAFNFASLNTVALCNADISVFFERLIQSKKLGFGFMTTYNFNSYVTLPNVFLRIVNNAKKNYDLGGFINFYPGHFRRKTTFYFGVLFKYTSFSFSKVVEDNTGGITTIKYLPAKGSQMATIIDVGTHTFLGKNFFLKTIAGIGGFKLRGDYKQQFNYILNQNNTPGDPVSNYSFLPKLYVGLNIGFNF